MIKRILVGLGTSATAETVTRHAIDIAKPQSAELVGLAVTDPLRLEWTGPRPMGVGVTAASADLVRHRVERAAADIQAASELFATRCRDAGVSHWLTEETGDPFEIDLPPHTAPVFKLGFRLRSDQPCAVAEA